MMCLINKLMHENSRSFERAGEQTGPLMAFCQQFRRRGRRIHAAQLMIEFRIGFRVYFGAISPMDLVKPDRENGAVTT